MRELACLNNVMPSTNTPAGRKNGGGGKENNVTEDSPRRGETNESGAQSLPNKTQEHRVLVPAVAASKPHRQSGSGRGDLPPHLASHLVRICGHQMTPRPARREGMGEDSPGDAAGGGVVPDRKCSPAATIINHTTRMSLNAWEGQFGGSRVRRQHGLPHQPIIDKMSRLVLRRMVVSPGDCDCNAEK
ncbi:hypothetical protein CABS03_11728 [Colletotrichum abscissum]